jgi:hypothetical protein
LGEYDDAEKKSEIDQTLQANTVNISVDLFRIFMNFYNYKKTIFLIFDL